MDFTSGNASLKSCFVGDIFVAGGKEIKAIEEKQETEPLKLLTESRIPLS